MFFVRSSSREDRLDGFAIAADGSLDAGETLWNDGDEKQLEAWLEEHREAFDWANPECP